MLHILITIFIALLQVISLSLRSSEISAYNMEEVVNIIAAVPSDKNIVQNLLHLFCIYYLQQNPVLGKRQFAVGKLALSRKHYWAVGCDLAI